MNVAPQTTPKKPFESTKLLIILKTKAKKYPVLTRQNAKRNFVCLFKCEIMLNECTKKWKALIYVHCVPKNIIHVKGLNLTLMEFI